MGGEINKMETIQEYKEELIFLLGYLSEEQMESALQDDELDKEKIKYLLSLMCDRYDVDKVWEK